MPSSKTLSWLIKSTLTKIAADPTNLIIQNTPPEKRMIIRSMLSIAGTMGVKLDVILTQMIQGLDQVTDDQWEMFAEKVQDVLDGDTEAAENLVDTLLLTNKQNDY